MDVKEKKTFVADTGFGKFDPLDIVDLCTDPIVQHDHQATCASEKGFDRSGLARVFCISCLYCDGEIVDVFAELEDGRFVRISGYCMGNDRPHVWFWGRWERDAFFSDLKKHLGFATPCEDPEAQFVAVLAGETLLNQF